MSLFLLLNFFGWQNIAPAPPVPTAMDKKFKQYNSLNFTNHPIRYSAESTTVIWISTQPISNYYGDTENVITFLMIQCFWT